MNRKHDNPTELRQRAAEYLSSHPKLRPHLSPEQALEELAVHQAELEMQNQELRETQAALERARDRYFNLFDLAPVAYFVFNEEHRVAELNLAAAELLGKERARLKGGSFVFHVASEYREMLHDHLNQAFATRSRQSVELRLNSECDGLRDVQLQSLVLPGELGAAPHCLTACADLTERRRAEEALRESELRFRQIAAAATDEVFFVASVNPERLLYLSEGFEPLTGLNRADLESNAQAWLEAVHPDDRPRVESTLKQHLEDQPEALRDVEYRLRRPDGSERWILQAFRPIRDRQGNLIRLCGMARDITARKQAEEQRLEFERRLLETQKLESLGVLAGGIAHDFNNLLTGILGHANLARMSLEPASEVAVSLKHIETAAQRAADLCRQMLAYSGRGRFSVEAIDLNQLIHETAHLMQFSIGKSATLKKDLAARLPRVMADATQMRQVLMNLVINASEAIGENTGFIHLSSSSRVAARSELRQLHLSPDLAEGEYVVLEIGDTGCGMLPETLARIFDPFFTTKFAGRGLGLAAVLGIVRGHHGGIKVTSTPGRGSTFRILLPSIGNLSGSFDTTIRHNSHWRTSGTALLVDDEEVVRKVGAHILQSFGMTVLEAVDGREGVALFQENPARISCVLLDLTMPHMTGEQVFTVLHKLRPDVPVILMSGYTEHEVLSRFSGKNLAGFLQKPFTPASLRDVLKRALAQPALA